MKRMNFRKTLGTAALIGGTIFAAGALADTTQDAYGPGYGMGYGPGYGMGYGPGHGMGYGPGYGMGYGMGRGMAGGRGYGMGPGAMGAYGFGSDLNLSAEQRGKIAKIQDDLRRKHWDLMGKIQDEQSQMNEQYDSDQRDTAALSKSYRKVLDMRQQMFDLSLEARNQIDAVLTKEQRDKRARG